MAIIVNRFQRREGKDPEAFGIALTTTAVLLAPTEYAELPLTQRSLMLRISVRRSRGCTSCSPCRQRQLGLRGWHQRARLLFQSLFPMSSVATYTSIT